MEDNTITFNEITQVKRPVMTLIDEKQEEIMSFHQNGEIYIKGKLATNDMDVVDGFRDFLNAQGYPAGKSFLKQVYDLTIAEPNDMKLGNGVRKIMNELIDVKSDDIQ